MSLQILSLMNSHFDSAIPLYTDISKAPKKKESCPKHINPRKINPPQSITPMSDHEVKPKVMEHYEKFPFKPKYANVINYSYQKFPRNSVSSLMRLAEDSSFSSSQDFSEDEFESSDPPILYSSADEKLINYSAETRVTLGNKVSDLPIDSPGRLTDDMITETNSKISDIQELSSLTLSSNLSKLSNIKESSSTLSSKLSTLTSSPLRKKKNKVKLQYESLESIEIHDKKHLKNNNKRLEYEQRRISDMMNMRINLAQDHGYDTASIRDFVIYDNYINLYRKGLPHNEEGFVDMNEMKKLLDALGNRDNKKLAQVKLGSRLKLVNPSAAWSNDIIGSCNNTYRYSRLPTLDSDIIAAQMVELYCMSYARDVPFHQYDSNIIIDDCCNYLNSLKIYPQINGRVTPYNIFRGPMDNDCIDLYISQFLYRDIKIGELVIKQKYPSNLEGYDFMKTWDAAISAQSGNIIEFADLHREKSRYIITGRDLACYVHSDNSFQTFYNTAIILMNLKVPMNPGIAKIMNENIVEVGFINLGSADIQSALTLIGRSALLLSWYVKWNTLFLRPEALGIEIERIFRDRINLYGISPELLKNPVLETIRSINQNVLLSQVYPEGCSLHPSTPSGHAAIAGACATVLKFFFDMKHDLDIYEPDENGTSLINTGKKTTVGDQINKLACNIGYGCMWSGINYYMDIISGLKHGEKVAISCLRDLIHRYPMDINISFLSFSGKNIVINKHSKVLAV